MLEPAIVTDVHADRSNTGTSQKMLLTERLRDQQTLFENIASRPALAFNAADDWDENGKLKPDAPVHSPFIRHARTDERFIVASLSSTSSPL